MKLKFLGLMVTIIVWSMVVGAPNTYAQQTTTNWTTYCNPEYRFSIDYPFDNKTNITDSKDFTYSFIRQIDTSDTSIAIMITESDVDPQELVLLNMMDIPTYKIPLEDGIMPLIIDDVKGYSFSVINDRLATIMTHMYFSYNDSLYSFIIMGPPGDFDTSGRDKVVKSIKFFD